MKKTRIIAFVVVLSLALSMLSACALFGGKTDVTKYINAEASYEAEKVYGTMMPVSISKDWSVEDEEGNLILFEDDSFEGGEKYIVYNAVTGSTVKEFIDTDDNGYISITLERYTYLDNSVEVIKYHKGTTVDGNTTHRYEVYDSNGNMLDGSDSSINVSKLGADVLAVNEKLYTIGDGVLNSIGSYNRMGKAPSISYKVDNYYYGTSNGYIMVYELAETFKVVSKYEIPEYAEDYEWTVLEGGNVFLQYTYDADTCGDKYDYLEDAETKTNIETVLIKAKNGSAKSIKCDYLIEGLTYIDAKYADEYGINSEVINAYGYGYKLEDKLDAYETYFYVTKKGDVKELGAFEGERIQYMDMVAADRWVVRTDSGAYLINGEGELIGDVTNVSSFYENYILFDGKVYDYDLNEDYDYEANGYQIKSSDYGYLMFSKDGKGAYLYTDNGNVNTICVDNENTTVSCFDGYYTVRTRTESTTRYEIFNAKGNLLNSFSANSVSVSTIYSNSDAGVVIIKVAIDGNTTVYAIK